MLLDFDKVTFWFIIRYRLHISLWVHTYIPIFKLIHFEHIPKFDLIFDIWITSGIWWKEISILNFSTPSFNPSTPEFSSKNSWLKIYGVKMFMVDFELDFWTWFFVSIKLDFCVTQTVVIKFEKIKFRNQVQKSS